MPELVLLNKIILVISSGILAQWVAWILKLPSIVFLITFGLVLGPYLGLLEPSYDFGALFPVIVKLSVAMILFEGGLNLHFFELKRAKKNLSLLVGIGLPLAWLLITFLNHSLLTLSWSVSFELGAILVVTGPTVILPLIRQTRLSPKISSLIKWEGILNDPAGALLAIVVFEFLIAFDHKWMFPQLFSGLSLASLLGIGAAFSVRFLFENNWISESLKIPLIVTLVVTIYACTNWVQEEAGLLAVTLFGLFLGNLGLRIVEDLRKFKEDITTLLLSMLFILLAASVETSYFQYFDWKLALFLILLIFIVRPACVFLVTTFSALSLKERFFLSAIAPRGIVALAMAGLLGPRLVQEGYPDAQWIIPIVFFVVLTTVVFHGLSFPFLARFLELSPKDQDGLLIVGAHPWSVGFATVLQNLGISIILVDDAYHNLQKAQLRSIQTYTGEILGKTTLENLDLTTIHTLFACSSNDAYNALVCSAFSSQFGSENVFQLPKHKTSQEQETVQNAYRGKILFHTDLYYEKLLLRYYQGWSFVIKTIQNDFSYETFLKENQEQIAPLCLIKKNGTLDFQTLKKTLAPALGDTWIGFVSPLFNLKAGDSKPNSSPTAPQKEQ